MYLFYGKSFYETTLTCLRFINLNCIINFYKKNFNSNNIQTTELTSQKFKVNRINPRLFIFNFDNLVAIYPHTPVHTPRV